MTLENTGVHAVFAISLVVALAACRQLSAAEDSPLPESIKVENGDVRLEFSGKGHGLRELFSKDLNDNMLKSTRGWSPFRVYPDLESDYCPHPWDDKFKSLKHYNTSDCRLVYYGRTKTADARIVELRWLSPDSRITITLKITLPHEGDGMDWQLKLANTGKVAGRVAVAFPFFEGIALGASADDDMVTSGNSTMKVFGKPPVYYRYASKIAYYGGAVAMQWLARFDREARQSMGVVVKDASCGMKKLEARDKRFMVVSYPARKLLPGQEWTLPVTTIYCGGGDWRAVAGIYRKWFLSKFKIRKPVKWIKNAPWSGASPMEARAHGKLGFHYPRDFRELPRLLDASRNLGMNNFELAGWMEGTYKNRVYNEGDYVPAVKMGGGEALREGVDRIHKRGGKLTVYVEGFITGVYSRFALSGRSRDCSLVNGDGFFTRTYHGRWLSCPKYHVWQDYLAEVCGRIVGDYDVDGIRLDTLGAGQAFLCYNRKHGHKTPYEWNEGVAELLKKVRAAIDKARPNCALLTEKPVDYYYQWIDASLDVGAEEKQGGESLLRWTFPEMTVAGLAKPVRLAEGYNIGFYGRHSPQSPQWFRSWAKMRQRFRGALADGKYLGPLGNPRGNPILRLHKARNYYLILGTKNKTPNLKISLPVLDSPLAGGWLIDIAHETAQPVKVDGRSISLTDAPGEFALYLPFADCAKSMVVLDRKYPLVVGKGVQWQANLVPDPGFKVRAKVSAPGLVVNGSPDGAEVALPGKVTFALAAGQEPGKYLARFEGGDLLGHSEVIDVYRPLEATNITFEPASNSLYLNATFTNYTTEKLNVAVKLLRPSGWKVLTGRLAIPAAPGRGKSAQTLARIELAMAPLADRRAGMLELALKYSSPDGRVGGTLSLPFNLLALREVPLDLLGREDQVLRNWLVAGPLPNGHTGTGVVDGALLRRDWPGTAYDRDFLSAMGGEKRAVAEEGQSFLVSPSKKLTWTRVVLPERRWQDVSSHKYSWREYWRGLILDPNRALGIPLNQGAYAATVITSEKGGKRTLLLKSDAAVRLWLNGEEVFHKVKTLDPGEVFVHRIPVTLRRGTNRILLKLVNKLNRSRDSGKISVFVGLTDEVIR